FVSIFVFTAIGPLLPELGLGRVLDNVLFFFLKLPFLPVIAAITFELQRLLARFGQGPLRLLLWPGFLVQRITTIEPDDAQLEVALGALAVTLGRERDPARAVPTEPEQYAGYGELLARTASTWDVAARQASVVDAAARGGGAAPVRPGRARRSETPERAEPRARAAFADRRDHAQVGARRAHAGRRS